MPRKARSFSELSETERAAFERLQAEFWKTTDPGRRQEILGEIDGAAYDAGFISMAKNILALHDEALSLAAVALLAGNTSPAILPALEIALADPSVQVRREAVMAVDQVRDDAVLGFFGKAFEDSDANVRLSTFNALDDQTRERRIKILSRALEATQTDVQTMAVDTLQLESTPQTVEALFPALDSASAELREAARFSLEFQLSQSFPNAAAARTWWEANRTKFDRRISRRNREAALSPSLPRALCGSIRRLWTSPHSAS